VPAGEPLQPFFARMDALIPLLVVALVALGALIGYFAAERRTRELARWADAKGWTFLADRDPEMENRFPQFPVLTTGKSRYAHNRIEGRWRGRPFVAFDYHYVTGSGKSQQTHRISCVVLTSGIPLKRLTLSQETLIHRVGAFFGIEDINFESAEFSRSFRVTAPDRRWAYDIFHARAIEMLLRSPRFDLDMLGTSVIACRQSQFSAGEFESALGLLARLLDSIPEYVVQQQAGSPARP
jgi:hypothetical protein